MLTVVRYPNPILEQSAADVTEFGSVLRQLVEGMAEAMYASKGVGLAAPQVGKSSRLILVDPSAGEVGNELIALANPKIVWTSFETAVSEEGCLSLPGIFLPVVRPVACDVEYLDVDGNAQSMRCTGWKARIVQHEVEHLAGITMLNKVGRLARRTALKNLASVE